MPSIHTAVLLHEVVQGFDLKAESKAESEKFQVEKGSQSLWYLDGTLGGCGHALAIAEVATGKLNIIGLDQDPEAVGRARDILAGKAERLILEVGNFRNLDSVLDKNDVRTVDRILFDLGMSSDLLENSGRGFSFLKDEPLIMTMGDPDGYPFTAKDILNGWKEEDIANVLYGYGEERFARRIARAIIGYRERKSIETSAELVEIVKGAVPAFYRRGLPSPRLRQAGLIHPATRTFQALRIAVNDELNALREGLAKGYGRLTNGGRMAVISFHSLEDRIVKDFYRQQAQSGGTILTKKPLRPGKEEIAMNPRARSAKLRIIERTVTDHKQTDQHQPV